MPGRRRLRPRRFRLAGPLAAVMLAAPLLAGCEAMDSILGRESTNGPLDCSRYQEDTPKDPAPLLMIMLDVSDNSPEAAAVVAERIKPYLETALREGQYIRLVASGGGDGGLTYSDCFHGDRLFLIDRDNDTREEKDRKAAVERLSEEINHIVQAEEVSPTGSVTGLLASINDEIGTLRSTPNVNIGKVTVVVWTDLLGTGEEADCLNVDGKKASVQIAEAMVKRCFDSETPQLTSIGDHQIRFLGVNEGSTTRPQQDLARYLKGELCRRISSDCG